MTRIGYFFHELRLGGTERQTLRLIEGLDRERFTPVAYAISDGPVRAELEKLGVPVRIAGWNPLRLRSFLKANQIDILHALLFFPNILGRFACAGASTRCINSIRWAERKPRDVLDYATRFLVDAWVANSEHGARLARLPREKTSIVENALPEALLKTPLKAWKPRRCVATMVAQMRREKRHDTVLAAAAMLPDWTFRLVGDGPLRGQWESLARELRLANVKFLGHRSDVPELLLESHVSILLSRSEGTPNAALEAMALGVPVVGSDIPAFESLLAEGRGWIVAQSDPDALAGILKGFADRRAKDFDPMRKAAQAWVREHCDPDRVGERFQTLYARFDPDIPPVRE